MKNIILSIPFFFLVGCFGQSNLFDDQTLQGKLSGKDWVAMHVSSQVYDFGGGNKKENPSIYSEACSGFSCLPLQSSSISFGNLDTSVSEGSFDLNNNITIYTPPSNNVIVTAGNYRVSNEGGKTKLEIEFAHDENNYLNGFIVY